jgi:hypothetical protein
MKRLFFIFLASIPLLLQAQDDDYNFFMKASNENAMIFRGSAPVKYGKKSPNDGSTYFAYSSDFAKGDIMYRGKRYYNILLNINAHADELYLKRNGSEIWILVDKNRVDYCFLGDRKFIYAKAPSPSSTLKEGFYEVIYDGRAKIYKKIKKNYKEDLSGERVKTGYSTWIMYYFYKDEKWYEMRNLSGIARHYKPFRKDIDTIIKEKKLSVREKPEEAYREVLNYLETSSNN